MTSLQILRTHWKLISYQMYYNRIIFHTLNISYVEFWKVQINILPTAYAWKLGTIKIWFQETYQLNEMLDLFINIDNFAYFYLNISITLLRKYTRLTKYIFTAMKVILWPWQCVMCVGYIFSIFFYSKSLENCYMWTLLVDYNHEINLLVG